MSSVNAAVLKAPGTNCDMETAYALTLAGAQAQVVWVDELLTDPARLKGTQILAIPGGFTYGDDLGAGRLLANELTAKLNDLLGNFLKEDRLIIGICNGFQVLVKSGILPSGKLKGEQEATLAPNDSGKFEDRWVYLKSGKSACVWTQGIPPLVEMPVAHGEGKFLPKAPAVVERLAGSGQIVFQYADSSGRAPGYPWNPNGSAEGITGVCDPSGRIFGLMPHPERHLFAAQHPRRTAEGRRGEGEGLSLFRNGVSWARKNL